MLNTCRKKHHILKKKLRDKLKKAGYIEEEIGQGKNDYGYGRKFCALLLAPKVKNCSTIKEYGVIGETIHLKDVIR